MRVVSFLTRVKMSEATRADVERFRNFILNRYMPWLSTQQWMKRYHPYATLRTLNNLATDSTSHYAVISYQGRTDKYDHNTLCHVHFKRVGKREVWCLSTGLLNHTQLFDTEDDMFNAAQGKDVGISTIRTETLDPHNLAGE